MTTKKLTTNTHPIMCYPPVRRRHWMPSMNSIRAIHGPMMNMGRRVLLSGWLRLMAWWRRGWKGILWMAVIGSRAQSHIPARHGMSVSTRY